MAKKTSAAELSIEITKLLKEYSTQTTDTVKKIVRRVGRETAKELRQDSPRDTGEYAAGWRSRVRAEASDKIDVEVYNSSKPQLTHLLEYGHAKVNGGRVEGIPHIRPAEEEAVKKLESLIKQEV